MMWSLFWLVFLCHTIIVEGKTKTFNFYRICPFNVIFCTCIIFIRSLSEVENQNLYMITSSKGYSVQHSHKLSYTHQFLFSKICLLFIFFCMYFYLVFLHHLYINIRSLECVWIYALNQRKFRSILLVSSVISVFPNSYWLDVHFVWLV